jgi:hypothetical protein
LILLFGAFLLKANLQNPSECKAWAGRYCSNSPWPHSSSLYNFFPSSSALPNILSASILFYISSSRYLKGEGASALISRGNQVSFPLVSRLNVCLFLSSSPILLPTHACYVGVKSSSEIKVLISVFDVLHCWKNRGLGRCFFVSYTSIIYLRWWSMTRRLTARESLNDWSCRLR